MMKKVTLLTLFIYQLLFTQVDFTESRNLFDVTFNSNLVTSMISSDLNNDGFKEIIIGSYYDNKIIFYKNINGDILHYQREILEYDSDGSYHTNFHIFCKDIDLDGFIDILVTHDFKDEIYWYKNLGNFNFSSKILIDSTIDKPTAILAEDIDKDGDIDVIVGSKNDKNVHLFVNDGNNLFHTKQLLYTTNYGVSKLRVVDLDNNGFLDIVSGNEAGGISWIRNIDGKNFSDKMYLAWGSGDGFEFDFIDINNDNFLDVFLFSNYDDNISYRLNENGISFSSNSIIVGNQVNDMLNMKVLDFDKDGKKDIVATTSHSGKIGWFQQKSNKTFSNFKEISNDVNKIKHFIIEDLNNNGNLEIITSNYYSSDQKISKFEIDSSSKEYEKTFIQINLYGPRVTKIADVDNDGVNDVISGFGRGLAWNKNYGNLKFSSPILISKDLINWVTDLELIDLNNDNFLDIIVGRGGKLELYKNNQGKSFNLERTITLENFVSQIELEDIDNNGVKDILISHESGYYPLSKIINKQNFNFESLESIYISDRSSYKDYSFKSADIDNDGDNDIVVGEKDKSILVLLQNNGLGKFEKSTIASSVACSDIDLGDIDNNGTIDIVVSGDNDYSQNNLNFFINSIKSNQKNPTFNKVFIDKQSLQSIILGDLNNDSYLDIIGTVYHPSGSGDQVLYYLFNGSKFDNKVVIDSPGNLGSLDKNASLGDLNNDDKIDILSTELMTGTIKYFINSFTLSTHDLTANEKELSFNIYPNPSSKYFSWNLELDISKIEVYNSLGKLVYRNRKNILPTEIDVSFLDKGVYYVKGYNNNSSFISKLILE